jgi:anion-transporting  ArsA/GET3 family ATPase
MLIDELLAPKILIVAGKGGVGKTTVSAALALVAARHGHKVCVAEVDRKGTLSKLFGGTDLGYEPAELSPGVWGMNIIPEDALVEYLEVQYHMKRVSRIFKSSHFVDYITTAAPGLKDILVLGKIWYLDRGTSRGAKHSFDTIIIDAPAAGHMLTFLSAPMGLSDALRVGPVRRQAEWLVQMLRDETKTRVHLVTLAEEMPATETVETADALETKLGIHSGPIFANAVYARLLTRKEEEVLDKSPGIEVARDLTKCADAVGLSLDAEDVEALAGYARFLSARRKIQATHLRTLKQGLGQGIVELPFLFSAGLALPDIETLADAIEGGVAKL